MLGNVFTQWLTFRLGQKKRDATMGLRSKAGSKLFGAIKKSQDGMKNKLKGKKGGGDDDEDEDEDEDDEDDEPKKKKKKKKGKGRGGGGSDVDDEPKKKKKKGRRGGEGGSDDDEDDDEGPTKRGRGRKGSAAMAKKRGGRGRSDIAADKTVAIRIDDIEEPLDVVGWVVALNGNHRGQDFRLHSGKNFIGTAADCDIVLTDPYLSSRHATIRHDTTDGSFTIIDIDSTNGTFLNDKRINKDELIDNDTLRLGRTELKFKALF